MLLFVMLRIMGGVLKARLSPEYPSDFCQHNLVYGLSHNLIKIDEHAFPSGVEEYIQAHIPGVAGTR